MIILVLIIGLSIATSPSCSCKGDIKAWLRYNKMNNLVGYSSASSSDAESESESEREVLNTTDRKRRASETANGSVSKMCKAAICEEKPADVCIRTQNSLPLPGAIADMFGKPSQSGDDLQQHGGRIRSVPHVEGNWASYVYIPVSAAERLQTYVDQVLRSLQPLEFECMTDLHISLSRTVYIRHHWIQPLTESLKEHFQQLESCLCDIGSLKMYTNDEKTRTFLSLEVSAEDSNLLEYIAAVDSCFQEFNLPKFYQNPSFHISLVWCVGDVISQIPEKTRQMIQTLTSEFLSSHSDLSVVHVKQVYLKTGNRSFAFQLQNE